MVFMATFAVVVYIIVKYGEAPKKCFVITIIIAVVVLWAIAFLGTSPAFSQAVIYTRYTGSLSCGFTPIATSSYVFVGLYLFFFGLITISVTITLLVITVCYIKHLNVQDIRLEEAIVKFGFFLLLGNGISLLGQFVPPLIVTLVILRPARLDAPPIPAGVTYSAYTLLNAALIPTPILVFIYFKPIQPRLWRWLRCCVPKTRKAKYIHNSNNLEVPMIQTATAGL